MDEESRLIRKIQKNKSRRAADLLVRKYYQEIYVYVYRQVGNKEDSMDISQEIFIGMLQTIDFFDNKQSSFRTWLYRIATNKVIDFRRKFKPITLSLDELEIEDATDHLKHLEESDLLARIEEYVSSFDDSTQTIFRLHIYDDRTFIEIAGITGLPESSVKSRYYRLQKKIRKEFSDYEI